MNRGDRIRERDVVADEVGRHTVLHASRGRWAGGAGVEGHVIACLLVARAVGNRRRRVETSPG
jgi:hypothetical protein